MRRRAENRIGAVRLGATGFVLAVGLVGVLHLVGMQSNRPLIFIAQVDGESMEPTLHDGQQLVCVRAPWDEGDIVVADVGESCLVVKRVVSRRGQEVRLVGDNRAHSESYQVRPEAIRSVMLCRLGVPHVATASAASEVGASE